MSIKKGSGNVKTNFKTFSVNSRPEKWNKKTENDVTSSWRERALTLDWAKSSMIE